VRGDRSVPGPDPGCSSGDGAGRGGGPGAGVRSHGGGTLSRAWCPRSSRSPRSSRRWARTASRRSTRWSAPRASAGSWWWPTRSGVTSAAPPRPTRGRSWTTTVRVAPTRSRCRRGSVRRASSRSCGGRARGSTCSCAPATPTPTPGSGDTGGRRARGGLDRRAQRPRGPGLGGARVVGATLPREESAAWRARMPNTPFLVPGFGAQGAGPDDVRPPLPGRRDRGRW
jgi:hypothetical protein